MSVKRTRRLILATILFGATGFSQALDNNKPDIGCGSPVSALLPECQAKTSTGGPTGSLSQRKIDEANPVTGAGDPEKPYSEAKPNPEAKRSLRETRKAEGPSTEFQRLTRSYTGEILPVFGDNLFTDGPSTFAPIERLPVTQEYEVGPGDEILLRTWGQVNLNLALNVDRSGDVYIPQVGSVRIAGTTYAQLQPVMKTTLGRVFRGFDLTATMGQLRSIQIYVVGYARQPGSYTVSSLSTLVNALFACGGPAPEGSMRNIQLIRGRSIVTEFDLYDLLLRGDRTHDVRLLPGDIVHFAPAGVQVALAGSIRRPAIYELKGNTTLADALELAGGATVLADGKASSLERISEEGKRETVALDLQSKTSVPLRNGDIVQVRSISPRILNAVTLRGNVASPGRFPYRPGMRIRDIVPNQEALITRDYWNKQNTVGFSAHAQEIADVPDIERNRSNQTTSVRLNAPEINWSYAVIERQDPATLRTQLIPFHPGKLLVENDATQDLPLSAGDTITFFSQADVRVPVAQQNRFVRIEGEVAYPGFYNLQPRETLAGLIARAGGITHDGYLYGAEFTRESTKAEQQHNLDEYVRQMDSELNTMSKSLLGRANAVQEAAELSARIDAERQSLARLKSFKPTGRIVLPVEYGMSAVKGGDDIQLEDGDHFYVPAKPATVFVMGAVFNPSAFLYVPEAGMKDYLQIAGGQTREADSKRTFVIRANGTVVSRRSSGTHSQEPFDRLSIHPGDAVVSPEYVLKSSFTKGIHDWAQTAAQFALGAAAINLLK